MDYLAAARKSAASPSKTRLAYDYGVRHFSEWDKFWAELSGEAADQGLRNLAVRVFGLERGERVAIETLERLATEATAARSEPFEAMAAAIAEALQKMSAEHQTMAARLENVVKQLERAQQTRVEQDRRMDSIRGDLIKKIEQLPADWRKDFARVLDELRTTPDAATALLFGGETFAAAVSKSLEDAQ
ncbi:MAG: hypothetical protein FD160_982 [Caulobacteraceae bacterium]|nr:MAG: hypothetical protein FD160_982 [Caulobacteraceae bacterium]